MDAGSVALLHRLGSMGSSSLLQYVSEAAPWSPGSAPAAIDQVMAIAREERDESVRLARISQKRHLGFPKMGYYPSHFTTMNFVSLDYLLPKLVTEHEKEISEIEKQTPLADDGTVRELAQGYLGMKRRHLQTLQELATSNAPAGAA